jgi:hypothetical protein
MKEIVWTCRQVLLASAQGGQRSSDYYAGNYSLGLNFIEKHTPNITQHRDKTPI